MAKNKFYTYRQNNSGGSFDSNDSVSLFVIIEAKSEESANEKAEEIGLYFDGCEKGLDCPCCGDRWSQYPTETTKPLIYGKNPEKYFAGDKFSNHWKTKNRCYIYYVNGKKKVIV